MNVWKDIYYECMSVKQTIELDIFNKEKEIEQMKQKLKENEKFFEKTFGKTIDKCIEMSYNEYIKEIKKE